MLQLLQQCCLKRFVVQHLQRSHLEVRDEVFKVMQLEQIIFTFSQHSKGSPHEDIGAVLCQHHINHPACKGGREGTAVDGQKPLGSIQHWHCSILLQIA